MARRANSLDDRPRSRTQPLEDRVTIRGKSIDAIPERRVLRIKGESPTPGGNRATALAHFVSHQPRTAKGTPPRGHHLGHVSVGLKSTLGMATATLKIAEKHPGPMIFGIIIEGAALNINRPTAAPETRLGTGHARTISPPRGTEAHGLAKLCESGDRTAKGRQASGGKGTRPGPSGARFGQNGSQAASVNVPPFGTQEGRELGVPGVTTRIDGVRCFLSPHPIEDREGPIELTTLSKDPSPLSQKAPSIGLGQTETREDMKGRNLLASLLSLKPRRQKKRNRITGPARQVPLNLHQGAPPQAALSHRHSRPVGRPRRIASHHRHIGANRTLRIKAKRPPAIPDVGSRLEGLAETQGTPCLVGERHAETPDARPLAGLDEDLVEPCRQGTGDAQGTHPGASNRATR